MDTGKSLFLFSIAILVIFLDTGKSLFLFSIAILVIF